MNAPFTPPSHAPATAANLAALPMIEKWISFSSVSRDSNLSLIDWTRELLESQGVHCELTHDDSGRKANLWATLPAENGETKVGGIVLSGHTDVVPVDGQPWDTDPFTATLVGDKLFGRGVTDMKGFGATALWLVPELLKRKLKRPVHLAFSYDEEVGCIGVRRMIAMMVDKGYRPAGCIVGEPTGMQVVIAHKGKHGYKTSVRGHEAHSSLTPLGVNAVEVACEFVTKLKTMARRLAAEGPFDPLFDVPYTTVHTGVIQGGTALNIIPRDCEIAWEIRHHHLDSPLTLFNEAKEFADSLIPAMQAVAPETGITHRQTSVLPGFATDAASEIAQISFRCAEVDGASQAVKVSFGTEAALFHQVGVPTIVCGPGHIAQAHQPNEWVTLDQLAWCERFMRRLADELCVN
ncbi:acetylornithine deacetylase [Xylophilus rhododendri]|uniref:Acetylornithine deacetylase n=1 Tax=Xylophilus rhododendri TaxID=2697032 RepID=A0A857J274_9BURK|nr:acetylornithine deacetylase [Xylophilus rhododendri]QHI97038.1 acetylornithine deacetylase [Xylophilus rhododendri]